MELNKQRIAELVGKVQSGDNSAFDELYKLTSERAYFVALEFTKNNQDAEDILQESYIKALSKIKELDKPESFSSWLNQIVANKSKDFLKKKKPMLFEAEDNEVFEVIPDEDTSFSPEENLDQTELQKTVMEVLDELSEEKRACILMMYFEELSVGEIAETLEIPEGTVKTRLFSARKDLKEKFSKRGITSAFSFAPIGVVIWAMRRAAQTVQTPAAAKMIAGITVAGTGTAAAAGTGVAAKIAALTVAQKVIAGVSVAAVVTGSAVGVATVVDNSKTDNVTTTAYTEEVTTAPSFETTLAIEAMGTVEFSETTDVGITAKKPQPDNTENSSSVKQTSAQSTTKNKTTEKSTAKSTTKATTTAKQTTTKTVTSTTKPVTTVRETTTKKISTTAGQTTTKPPTTAIKSTTTTKPTTTEATTLGKATVIINVLDLDNNLVEALSFSVDAGTVMSNNYLWDLVEAEGYTISDVYGSDKGSTAQAGETYTFKADIFEV